MIYEFIPGDFLVTEFFEIFCWFMLGFIVYAVAGTSPNYRRFMAVFFGFLGVFILVVATGLPLAKPIPVIPIMFLSILALATFSAFSDYGKNVADEFSFSQLIGFQGFRLPLELVLHQWASTGTVPETMTWTGQNWDIVTGILSLIAIPFVNKNKRIAWTVQIVGFVLLLNVLRVVIMSSPLPFSWQLERPILLIGYLPYALIGPLFVGVALTLHLITFRKLLNKIN